MVEYVSVSDFYEVRLASLLTNVDKDTIIELYQPIIGATPAMLYLNLLKQKRNEEEEIIFSMDKLISTMQVTPGQILNARHALEAVGLMSTYEKDNGENRSYIFVLYSPKTPKDFFDDILFKGLLVQAVGKREAQRLAKKYVIDLSIPKEYKNVTASFVDVFSPNYDDNSFFETFDETIVGRKTKKIRVTFSADVFFKAVEENSQIRKEVFTKEDIKQLESIATLYGVNEITIALAVIDVYDGYTMPHVNYDEVKKIIEDRKNVTSFKKTVAKKSTSENKIEGESTLLIKKVNMMESLSPATYLKFCKDNIEPTSVELDTIDKITMKYNLPNGVLNALIEYTLHRCKGILRFKYMDAVASSLVLNHCKTATDAMNYLSKKRSSSSNTPAEKEIVEPVVSKPTEDEKDKELSDAEMEEILSGLKSKKKGKK